MGKEAEPGRISKYRLNKEQLDCTENKSVKIITLENQP